MRWAFDVLAVAGCLLTLVAWSFDPLAAVLGYLGGGMVGLAFVFSTRRCPLAPPAGQESRDEPK